MKWRCWKERVFTEREESCTYQASLTGVNKIVPETKASRATKAFTRISSDLLEAGSISWMTCSEIWELLAGCNMVIRPIFP
jgi:hypothetical protein